MKNDSGKLIYEGKAKKIYTLNDPDKVLVFFKNDTTAFNAQKKDELKGKGYINCMISAHMFELLESKGVENHYLGLADNSSMFAQRVEVIPLEIVVRNIAYGSLCRQTPIALGSVLEEPLLDFYYKDDSLNDPLLTDQRLDLLGLIDSTQKDKIQDIAFNVNKILQGFFMDLDLELVDFKLEMGMNKSGDLLVVDEISPDNCRIWDKRIDDVHDRILDKDRFRHDLGSVVESYGEILKRIQIVSPKPRYCK